MTAVPSQRGCALYQQINNLRGDLRTQPPDQTEAQLDELAGQLLSACTNSEVDDGGHENLAY